jgi:antitoxin (DNA-binding transcriptional repressor) of toxin-antitoxin stability system
MLCAYHYGVGSVVITVGVGVRRLARIRHRCSALRNDRLHADSVPRPSLSRPQPKLCAQRVAMDHRPQRATKSNSSNRLLDWPRLSERPRQATPGLFDTISRIMNATVDEIEKHPSEYLHRVLEGETVVVFSADRAVAEIRPLGSGKGLRPIGLAAGEFVVPDDFDDPLPQELLDQFEGK